MTKKIKRKFSKEEFKEFLNFEREKLTGFFKSEAEEEEFKKCMNLTKKIIEFIYQQENVPAERLGISLIQALALINMRDGETFDDDFLSKLSIGIIMIKNFQSAALEDSLKHILENIKK